jgi:hypothetical protein
MAAPNVTIATGFIYLKLSDLVLGKIIKWSFVRDLVEGLNWQWASLGRRVLLNLPPEPWQAVAAGGPDSVPLDGAEPSPTETYLIIRKEVKLGHDRMNLDISATGTDVCVDVRLTDTAGGGVSRWSPVGFTGTQTTTLAAPTTVTGPGSNPEIIIEVRLGKKASTGSLTALTITETPLVTGEFNESP